jgi:hypothetical protein
MKIKLSISILTVAALLSSRELAVAGCEVRAAKVHDSLVFHWSIAISKIGLAPFPVQPLEYPCVSAFVSLKNGNWSYDPDLTCTWTAKPWIINNWIHYRLFNKKKLHINAGINPFLYFANTKASSQKQALNATQNLSAELSVDYKFSTSWSANLDYRYDQGFNNMVLKGNFSCVSVSKVQDLSTSLYTRINVHGIYFGYPGHFHGSFVAGELILGSKKLPVLLSLQAMQQVGPTSNVSPFLWNTGFVISL